MKAIVATANGPALEEVPTPQPGAKQVLVKVRAAALNRADLGMLKGASHGAVGGAGTPLGLEWAGEIVEIGAEVTNWQVGDRVMAAGGNAFAEFALGSMNHIYPMPDNLTFEQAATFPVALQTEHDAIVSNGQLERGQSVLIQGASSGVGLIGMQVAKAMGAGLVIGTSTSPSKLARLREFGADIAIDTTNSEWADEVVAATEDKGVDLLIDHVSGFSANDNLKATKIGGRIVNVGRLGGQVDQFNFDLHALRRIQYIGVTFRTRTGAEVADIVRKTTADLFSALTAGRFSLPIFKTFPLAEANSAFELMLKNDHFGKIVLTI